MRPGKLDRSIALQRRTASGTSARGEVQYVWAQLGNSARRAASYQFLSGGEREGIPQLTGREMVEFRIRWSSDIADLSVLDRIVYPASDAGDSPIATRSLWDITAVGELGRREGLRIIAARKVDVI